MQPAGRVDEDGVGLEFDALLHRLERDRGRIAAFGTTDGLRAYSTSPRLELVRGCGAERVGGAEHDLSPVGDEQPGDLAAGGGLAGAVDTDHQHHRRTLANVATGRQRSVEVRIDELDQALANECTRVVDRAGAEHLRLGPQRLDEFGGGADPDVGGEQQLLDLVPGLVVEVVAREQREQAFAQSRFGSREPGAQSDQPTGGRLRSLGNLSELGGLGDLDGLWLRRRPALPHERRRRKRRLNGSTRCPPAGASHEECAAHGDEHNDGQQDFDEGLHDDQSPIGRY